MTQDTSSHDNGLLLISNWHLNGRAAVIGEVSDTQRSIRTSPIRKRVGDVVTTKSGSNYRLDMNTPHHYVSCQRIRDEYFGGAKTLEEAVDYAIKVANEQ